MKFFLKKNIFFYFLIFGFSLLYAQGIPSGDSGRFPPPPQFPKDPDNIIKYRGNRTYSENLPLKIIQTKCTKKEGKLVFIEIIFNQSINPRSIKPDSILINNTPLPPFVRFLFNKKGTSVKMLVPLTINSFKMRICNIRSFNNTFIEPVELLIEVER